MVDGTGQLFDTTTITTTLTDDKVYQGDSVTHGRVHRVICSALAKVSQDAVTVTEGESVAGRVIHLAPRAEGAIDIHIHFNQWGLDVFIGDTSPVEITAPLNVNAGPPELRWDQDLESIVLAISQGQAVLGYTKAGKLNMVDIFDSRLGVNTGARGQLALEIRRAASWT